LVAADALALLPPITSSSIIHDNASGPGFATRLIIEQAKSQHLDPLPTIHAPDLAEGMIKATQALIDAQKLDTVTAQVMDAQNVSGLKDNTFTHSITNFVIFALPHPVNAASEIYRTLNPGGVAAVTTWRYSGSLDLFRRVQRAVRPDKPAFDPISRDWDESWKIVDVMEEGGFSKDYIKITLLTL
jgi:ubiquinone/menaquinone biosynthesis C-methylase UbiE